MTGKRKTIEVDKVRRLANDYLTNSAPPNDRERAGVASLLEQILLETGNYHGYGYTIDNWRDDETRRVYYK